MEKFIQTLVETRTQFPLLTDNIKLLHENPRPYHFSNECDKQVVLDYGFEKKPLVQVVVEKAKEIGCDASEQAVMWEGQCMECDCAVALMNMLAVQAAELHATLDWEGNAWFAGTVEGTALILPSSTPDSTKRFRITVDDSGTITAEELVE